jgi:DNA mismatch repair protein MutL
MLSKIQRLSSLTINQIAAGEVIENPASVVKEVVENAIDALASHITIEILAGGFQSIKISDDGVGMSREDALLCLERHTTSKLIHPEDLLTLSTLGFRGEALASIASISKMSLLTSTGEGDATLVEVEGELLLSVTPAARTRGTTLEIRSLFYNVPARKKFQKSPTASSAEITKILTQLALAHPEVGFTFIQQQRCAFSTKVGRGEEFLPLLKIKGESLLAADFLPNCKDLYFKEGDLLLQGVISDPLYARQNRSGQYLFVNRRSVICPAISYAIKDAYGTRLDTGKYPLYLLHLSISSDLIDVNVHPQKKEIRLKNEGALKNALHRAINAALGGSSVFTEAPPLPSFSALLPPLPFHFLLKEDSPTTQIELPLEKSFHLIGLYGKYLLATGLPCYVESGLVFVDLYAAEKRIEFEKLVQETAPISQRLLFPVTVTFSLAEAALLKESLPLLQNRGIHLQEIGKTSFLIDSIPPFLQPTQMQSLLETLLDQFSFQKDPIRQIASHLSRYIEREGKQYTLEEAGLILKNLLQTTDPLHCPQGRSTLFQLKETTLESYFNTKKHLP